MASSKPETKSSDPPAFEFITLTERPASHKNDFSYTVRSRAMQSFLHQKRTAKSSKEGPNLAARSSAESKTAGQLSGKFKLTTWSRKPRRKTGKRKPVEPLVEAEDDLDVSDLLEVMDNEQTLLTPLQPYGNSLPIPVEDTNTKALLNLTSDQDNTAFIVNAFVINFDNAWKPFSITDSALLHATLCLVAQHQDLLRGTEDSSENLWHKGKVMRVMNGRLSEARRAVTGADITSVALLVILESINGTLKSHPYTA